MCGRENILHLFTAVVPTFFVQDSFVSHHTREYDCEGGPDAKICETTTSTCGCRATKGKKERHDVEAQDH